MGQTTTRGSVCVVIAAREDDEHLDSCLESVRAHTPADIPILTVESLRRVVADLDSSTVDGDEPPAAT